MMYHACPVLLKEGSIIKPGRWGRTIKVRGTGHLSYQLETIFENIRRIEFPERPSRLNCNYLSPTIEGSLHFVLTNNRNTDTIYEVEIMDNAANSLMTDWSIIKNKEGYEDLVNTARRYWSNIEPISAHRELLTTSEIKIIRSIEVEEGFDLAFFTPIK